MHVKCNLEHFSAILAEVLENKGILVLLLVSLLHSALAVPDLIIKGEMERTLP